MTCTYHQEYNAAKLACLTAAPFFNNYAAAPGNFLQVQVNNGAANLVIFLNALDGMYQAVNTFINSVNFPPGLDPQDQNDYREIRRITFRRSSQVWGDRRDLLHGLVQMLRALGAGRWAGQGGNWF